MAYTPHEITTDNEADTPAKAGVRGGGNEQDECFHRRSREMQIQRRHAQLYRAEDEMPTPLPFFRR